MKRTKTTSIIIIAMKTTRAGTRVEAVAITANEGPCPCWVMVGTGCMVEEGLGGVEDGWCDPPPLYVLMCGVGNSSLAVLLVLVIIARERER